MLNFYSFLIRSVPVFVLLVFAGNHGISKIQVGPVPIIELMLLVFLSVYAFIKIPIHSTFPIFIYFSWFLFSFIFILKAFPSSGIYAFRDGIQVLDSLYVFVGFACCHFFFSSNTVGANYFYKIRALLYFISIFYCFAYLVGAKLTYITLVNTYLLFIVSSLVFYFNTKSDLTKIFISILFLIIGFLIFEKRTIYFSLICSFAVMIFFNRSARVYLPYLVLVFSVFFLLLYTFIEPFSSAISKIYAHLLTSFGVYDVRFVSAYQGVVLRGHWFSQIFKDLMSSWDNIVFGLGYGIPLTDFLGPDGKIIREPHNSFLSVIARSGLVGFSLWLSLNIIFIKNLVKVIINTDGHVQRYFIICLFYILLVFVLAISQDALERNFNVAPLYFIYGVSTYYYSRLKNI